MTMLRLLPLVLFAACATRSAIEASREQAALGQYGRAFTVLDDQRNAQLQGGGGVSADLETAWLEAKKRFLLFRAERLIFTESEDGALADLVELDTLQPDYPGAATLRSRAMAKKAERVLLRGEESLMRKDFVAAMASFLESQTIVAQVTGHEDAVEKVQDAAAEGIKSVGAALAQLSSRAQEQFLEAVRKLPEFRYVEVQWHANNVVFNAPDRIEAKTLAAEARRQNALKAMARGRECEAQGRFGAALLDFKEARALDKDVPGVDAAIAAMAKEQQAALHIESANKLMRLARFDEARAELGQAFELSIMARNEIGALVTQAHKMEGERDYQAARDLEVLGRKEEALAAFTALAKQWPQGFQDEQARIKGLQVDIDGARTEWAAAEAAEAAGDAEKALDHYINSERFYAGWKDGKARIARLRAAMRPGSRS